MQDMEAKGLVVIGVTDEGPELVDSWVRANQPTYPVVIVKDPNFEKALFEDPSRKGFPSAAVVSPDGTITYKGSAWATSSPVGEALKSAEKGSVFPKTFAKIAEALRSGEVGDAYDDLRALIDGGKLGDDAEKEWADRFRGYAEGLAGDALTAAKSHVEENYVLGAVETIEPFLEAETAFPATEELKKLLSELEALPTYKDELKGGKMVAEARKLEKEGEYVDAVKTYVKVYKKYEDAKIAALARSKAQDLVDKGMPGFNPACEDCGKKRAACERHHEDVKL